MHTRRDFVEMLSLASLGALASGRARGSALPSLERRGQPQHVLIVGAGLAGLASAYLLKQAGHRATIFEARTRPGGRVLTAREPFAEGLHGELGPARIPEGHARMSAWIAHFGLQTEPFAPARGDRLDVVRGKKIRYRPGESPPLDAYPLAFTDEEHRLGAAKVIERWMAPLQTRGIELGSHNWPSAPLRRFDAMNTRQYTLSIGLSEAVDQYMNFPFEDPEGENFSVLWLHRIGSLGAFDRPMLRIRGGNDRLPEAMARSLAADIRYGAPLIAILQDENGVTAVIERGGSRENVTAQRAIIAAPFTPIRAVEFRPALSAGKQRAIREMHHEDLARVLLQLNTRPWEKDGLAGWARTDLPSEIWHLSHDRAGPRALYSVYLKSSAVDALKRLDEPARLQYAARHVDAVFPGVAAAVEGGLSKVWSEDRWAGNAHAGLAPGQVTALSADAKSVEGRIHFAGEHTSPWTGWMEGAIESGERAAREVNV